MKELVREKAEAIALRRKGCSYKEILQHVPVAKSSLSLWLKDFPLTKNEKSVLKQRTDSNISHGRIKAAAVLRQNRLQREVVSLKEAQKSFQLFKDDPLFHSGITLYWAEGSKRSGQWQFSNSDVAMIEVMLVWLETYIGLKRTSLKYRLYAHKAYAHEQYEDWWIAKLGLSEAKFGKTTYKPSQYDFKKRPDYKGCFRIEVPNSRQLMCKMKFWQKMLVEYYKEE